MSSDIIQDGLFPDPVGVRLRQAREAAGMSVESVGQQLKLPVAIVEAMEREDWDRLGAPIYVRSYLGSYLRLMELPADLVERAAHARATPALVALGSRSRVQRAMGASMRNLGYLAMTALLVVPVFLVARNYHAGEQPELLTLEPSAAPASAFEPAPVPPPPLASAQLPAPIPAPVPPAADAIAATAGTAAAPPALGERIEPDPSPAPAAGPAPVMASMAPLGSNGAGSSPLVLRFSGESWVDVVDAQGGRVERGLVEAGAERRYAAGQVARITLGRADAVDVSFAGKAVDLAPFRAANVARFAVSSEGEPAPAGN